MEAIYFNGFITRIDSEGYIDLDPIYVDYLIEGLAAEREAPSFFIGSEKIAEYLNKRQAIIDESIVGAMIKPPVKVVDGVHYATPLLAGHYILWLDNKNSDD